MRHRRWGWIATGPSSSRSKKLVCGTLTVSGHAWQDPTLPFDYPLAIYRDTDHNVWLGYGNSVIVSHDAQGYHSFAGGNAANLGNVLTFGTAQNRLWAAGTTGVAYLDRGAFHRVTMKHGGAIRGVSGVVADRAGDLWLNTSQGIARISSNELEKAILHDTPVEYDNLNDRQGLVGTATQRKPTPSAVSDKEGATLVLDGGRGVLDYAGGCLHAEIGAQRFVRACEHKWRPLCR